MDSLVSVIIPVYNVERYLDKCMEGVLSQTYKNLEIILVDDGSPDNCPSVCDEYAKKDERIKVIHKANGGLSSARNAGLEVMSGEYFAFIDSDDEVDIDYIYILKRDLEQSGADISVCSFLKYTREIEKQERLSCKVLTPKQAFSDMLNGQTDLTVSWGKLYRTSVFGKFRFIVGKNNEDEFYINDIYHNAKIVCYNPTKLYFYRQNPNGIIYSKFTPSKMSAVDALIARDIFLKENGYTEFIDLNIKTLLYKIATLYFEAKKAKCKDQLRQLREYYKKYYYKNNSSFNKKDSFRLKLFKCSPTLYRVVTEFNRRIKCRTK